MQFVSALTGRLLSGSTSPIQDVIALSSLHVACAWERASRKRSCGIGSSRCAKNEAGGTQRTESTQVLARVRSLSHVECVGETLRAVVDDVAALAPDWLVQHITSDWLERDSHRVEHDRLPKAESQRMVVAQQSGADGLHL